MFFVLGFVVVTDKLCCFIVAVVISFRSFVRVRVCAYLYVLCLYSISTCTHRQRHSSVKQHWYLVYRSYIGWQKAIKFLISHTPNSRENCNWCRHIKLEVARAPKNRTWFKNKYANVFECVSLRCRWSVSFYCDWTTHAMDSVGFCGSMNSW